jgi:hypothetical protein
VKIATSSYHSQKGNKKAPVFSRGFKLQLSFHQLQATQGTQAAPPVFQRA